MSEWIIGAIVVIAATIGVIGAFGGFDDWLGPNY